MVEILQDAYTAVAKSPAKVKITEDLGNGNRTGFQASARDISSKYPARRRPSMRKVLVQ